MKWLQHKSFLVGTGFARFVPRLKESLNRHKILKYIKKMATNQAILSGA